MFAKKLTGVIAAGVLTLTLAACGSSEDAGTTTSAPASSAPMESSQEMTSEEMTTEESSGGMTSESMDPAADLVGAGCADYAAAVPDGAGSVAGMAQDPVATAASNNPLLTTLVAAVSGELNPDVDLVSTLNSSEFTVFAPVDDAFAKIDPATIETLKTDSALLTSILTYHVVPGRLSPADIEGEHETVEGGTVTVTGSGDNLMVNDASVICGGVQTANATVYLIDTVLMPTDGSTGGATSSGEMTSGMADPASNLVGPGCADYAAAVPDGAGSVAGMAQDPVATAASNNPLLTTLVAAVSGQLNPDVDLVSTLNSAEFTVFAPVDDAFAKIDPATIETLKTDSALLTKILTYHVVPGKLDPASVIGTQTTVEGGTVEVAGSGDAITVNDANVICGGVQTANATVYLIDSVLMPTS